MILNADEIISRLGLVPHPEGGYFRETYRSNGVISSGDGSNQFPDSRAYCTAIYYLLSGEDFSALHRIRSDEIWHFYQGCPLLVYAINPEGTLLQHQLGTDIANGQSPQIVVKAECWFGAHLYDTSSHALVGCTVAPGFDFRDFELGQRKELIAAFPQYKNMIEKLTRTANR